MIVLIHVIVALTSLVLTSLTYFAPSKRRLRTSYGLVGLTVATGTYLVVATNTRMLEVCVMGVAFVGFSLYSLVAARHKLART